MPFQLTGKKDDPGKQDVFVKHQCPQWQQRPKWQFFWIKVKVTRLLTLVSIEKVLRVENACHIWLIYPFLFKSYSQGSSHSHRQAKKNRCP